MRRPSIPFLLLIASAVAALVGITADVWQFSGFVSEAIHGELGASQDRSLHWSVGIWLLFVFMLFTPLVVATIVSLRWRPGTRRQRAISLWLTGIWAITPPLSIAMMYKLVPAGHHAISPGLDAAAMVNLLGHYKPRDIGDLPSGYLRYETSFLAFSDDSDPESCSEDLARQALKAQREKQTYTTLVMGGLADPLPIVHRALQLLHRTGCSNIRLIVLSARSVGIADQAMAHAIGLDIRNAPGR